MLRLVFRLALIAVLLLVLGVGWMLTSAHLQIRRVQPPLPSVDAIRGKVLGSAEGPVRLLWVNTSAQDGSRATALGAEDPFPERPYRLCHSVFLLEWADGRRLSIDAGMSREEAEAFGAMGEWAGAEPVEVMTTLAETLALEAKSLDALVFTHLHVDHVEGATELCGQVDGDKVPVFLTSSQAKEQNLHTSGGLATLESLDCLELRELAPEPIAALPGFAGAYVITAGGHTPGSQLIVVALKPEGPDGPTIPIVFTGDTVIALDGALHDISKPALYSAVIVPEDDRRLGEVRRLLRALSEDAKFEVLVSHDEHALRASALLRSQGPTP